jgi:hypothetical protein
LKLPEDTKSGDLFWFNKEPVRVTNWCYLANQKYCFDLEFISVMLDGSIAAMMVQIPMGFDFYGVEIRKMTPLEEQLY